MPDVTPGVTIEEQIENACEWIETLARAEFPKGMERLARGDSRCCLGVARDIVNGSETNDSPDLDESQEYCGLLASAQLILSDMNDGFGGKEKTHPEIASEILRFPDTYFTPRVAYGVKEYFYG